MVPTGRLAWWHAGGVGSIDHDDDPAKSGWGTRLAGLQLLRATDYWAAFA